MNAVLAQLGIENIFSNLYRPQDNSHIENIHNFLKRTLSCYLVQMQNGIRSCHLPATDSTQPPQLTTWRVQYSSSMVETHWKATLDYVEKVILGI